VQKHQRQRGRVTGQNQRPGYAAISAVHGLPPDDAGWTRFLRDVLDLPLWLAPAVQVAIRQASWRQALNPLETVRENAHRAAIRMDLKPERAKGRVADLDAILKQLEAEREQVDESKKKPRNDNDLMSTIKDQRDGPDYAKISAVARPAKDDPAWLPFMEDVLDFPMWMLPAVQWAIRLKVWQNSADPIAQLRVTAKRAAARMNLNPDVTKGD
jgi:hypothetical protein